MAKVYVANQTIHLSDGDDNIIIQKGERVRAGHPYLKGREAFFDVAEATQYDVESATAGPGEKRGSAK